MQSKTKVILILSIAALMAGSYWFYSQRSPSNRNRIVLIGIDGGDWEILTRLVSQGKMPHFKKLMDEGASGRLNSLIWRELIHGSRGYYSPIVWAGIATGKIPSKNGIEDFTLPLPSRLLALLVPANETGYASISLPETSRSLARIRLRARAASPNESIMLDVYLNDTSIKQLKLGKNWEIFYVTVPDSAIKENNVLHFYYQVRKEGVGKPAAEFNFIRLYDANQHELSDLHFIREKGLYKESWQIKDPDLMTMASSFHLRTQTLWDILSAQKRKVAVIGWWATYPATPVNGYLISSHVGHQGLTMKGVSGNNWLTKLKQLTYPENYLTEVQKEIFLPQNLDVEIVKKFYEIGHCSCIGSTQDYLFKSFYWQDRLFEKLGIDLLKRKGPFDFFSVYFRGVDTAGHQFLQFSASSEFFKDCTGCDKNRLPEIVDNYYVYMDEAVGRLTQSEDANTVTIIVTDHGQVASGNHGTHRNNGFILLHGKPVRKHHMLYANVLDVAPTVLYLLNVPVAQDMDGSVMIEAFDPTYLKKHPITMIGTYESPEKEEKKEEIIDQERDEQELEELKALGYIQG